MIKKPQLVSCDDPLAAAAVLPATGTSPGNFTLRWFALDRLLVCFACLLHLLVLLVSLIQSFLSIALTSTQEQKQAKSNQFKEDITSLSDFEQQRAQRKKAASASTHPNSHGSSPTSHAQDNSLHQVQSYSLPQPSSPLSTSPRVTTETSHLLSAHESSEGKEHSSELSPSSPRVHSATSESTSSNRARISSIASDNRAGRTYGLQLDELKILTDDLSDDWVRAGELPGEKLVMKIENVMFLSSIQTETLGTLIMTNYRIFFQIYKTSRLVCDFEKQSNKRTKTKSKTKTKLLLSNIVHVFN